MEVERVCGIDDIYMCVFTSLKQKVEHNVKCVSLL